MTPIDYHNHNDYWRDHDPYNGMTDEERMASGCLQGAALVVVIIVALLLCGLLGSCKPQEHIVTIETVRTDTTYITRHERDSIHVHDSTHVSEKQRGDTVFVEVSKWRTKYVERLKHDTIFIARHDTVPHPYPVIQEVPAPLTWWQQMLQRIGLGALASMFGWIAWMVIKLYLRKR